MAAGAASPASVRDTPASVRDTPASVRDSRGGLSAAGRGGAPG
ncbi:hypothetical protein [Streptomyces sp. NPDC058657]